MAATTTTKTTSKTKIEAYILNKLDDLNKKLDEANAATKHGFDRKSTIDAINGGIEVCKDILNALKQR